MISRKIYTGILAGSLCFFMACGNTANEGGNESEEVLPTAEMEAFQDEHYAANSLDYFGTYVGVLPCADCEGTPVEVVIAADSTFLYTTSEPDGENEPEVLTGKWNIDRNTITLGQGGPAFHVAENRLIPIGDDGNRYTGEQEDKFALHKLN